MELFDQIRPLDFAVMAMVSSLRPPEPDAIAVLTDSEMSAAAELAYTINNCCFSRARPYFLVPTCLSYKSITEATEFRALSLNPVGNEGVKWEEQQARTTASMLWTDMTNLQVRNTTRQEILQNICRQYMGMKEQLIRPLLGLLLQTQDPEVAHCYAVILHAWSSFPLVVQGRYQLPVDDALSDLQAGITALDSFSTAPLTYWKTKLFLLQQTVLSDGTSTNQSFPFHWTVFDNLSDSSWDGSPFSIDEKNEAVALWYLLCENVPFLPQRLVEENAERFAGVLIRSLVKNQREIIVPGQHSFRSVAEQIFASDVIPDCPPLHSKVVQALERALHNALEMNGHSKGSKKSTKLRVSVANAVEIITALGLLEQVGFTPTENGTVQFSLSLIWKSFEYVLESPVPWTHSPTPRLNFTDFQRKFGTLIMSVPSTSGKYWANTLMDFNNLVPKILEGQSSTGLDSQTELLEMLTFQRTQLMVKIVRLPEGIEECRLIMEQMDSSKDPRIAASTLASMLDVVLDRMDRPGAVKLGLEVLFRLAELYQKFLTDCLMKWQELSVETAESGGADGNVKDEALVHTALVINHSLRLALTKFERNSVKSTSDRMGTLKTMVPLDTATECLTTAAKSKTKSDMKLALCHVALVMRIHSKYSVKVFKKLLKLFRSSLSTAVDTDDEEMPLTKSEQESEKELSELDDKALFQVLLSMSERLKLRTDKQKEVEVSGGNSNLTECADILRELFVLFAQHVKPHKLVPVLSTTMRTLITLEKADGKVDVGVELMFYKLLAAMEGCHLPALSKELAPLHREMSERLAGISASSDHKAMLETLTLLRTLVRNQPNPEVVKISLSAPVYECLHRQTLTDEEFTALFEKCSALLFDVIANPRLVSPMTTPIIIRATSKWLTAVLQRARQESQGSTNAVSLTSRKSSMVRNASFVERLLGIFAKHEKVFSKLVVYIVAAYCQEAQYGTLYPEAKEHILAGLYRLMDMMDIHSRSMGAAAVGVELREIYKTLVEDHQRFHKYRGLL